MQRVDIPNNNYDTIRPRRVSSATTNNTINNSGEQVLTYSLGQAHRLVVANEHQQQQPQAQQHQSQGQPRLQKLVPRTSRLHPDDDADHVLPVIFAILERAGNRAMSVKELGEAAFIQGWMRTSPSAAAQAIGTHIRHHMNRHQLNPENALLKSYKLEGGAEDVRIAPALFCASPASCRRGTTVWYLSITAGKQDPFERLGLAKQDHLQEDDNSDYSIQLPLKRKSPPDDLPDLERPNKIRITLRLPPRNPIPRRARPVATTTTTAAAAAVAPDTSDESSEGDERAETESRTPSETDDEADDDDEDMLDDFNSLLADDVPIAIPCARSSLGLPGYQPFFDTCEPPPDSEDEDDDFHNSMLRPDEQQQQTQQPDHQHLFAFKQEDLLDFDIKEEDLAAIVLGGSPEPSTSSHQQSQPPSNVKLEDGLPPSLGTTTHPELEWSALHTEDGMFSPMELLGADSPASVDIDETSAGVSSPATFPDVTSNSHHSLTVPPPTPWIKTEEDSTIFFDVSDPTVKSTDLHTVDDDFAPVQSPVAAIPIPASIARPWETKDWIPIPGPESVSTDDVERHCDEPIIVASTSAPITRVGSNGGRTAMRRPRLSMGGLTPFHQTSTANPFSAGASANRAAGHLRRHSHAAGVMPNRRLSIISTAFSDWTSGTPEDAEAPLATPSHTGWRMQWPVPGTAAATSTSGGGGLSANGSSSTLAHEKIEEGALEDEDSSSLPLSLDDKERKSPIASQDVPATDRREIDRLLALPSFNQVISKGLPPNIRIATMILLGIPIFQCRVENPPINLYRRMDTDYVNLSALLTYVKHLAHATMLGRSRTSTGAAGGTSTRSQQQVTSPTVDELPSNHVFINSGARDIHGGWVPLATARSVTKNYHDLPAFVRRMFLSDSLADKFPQPIPAVKQLLLVARISDKATIPQFGKPFAKPDSLSARDLLTSGSQSTAATAATGATAATSATGAATIVSPVHTPVPPTVRNPSVGAAHVTGGNGSYPLSPVAVLSHANALAAAASGRTPMVATAQSLLSLLSQSKGWAANLVKTPVEPEPLMPEEEEMFKALVKSPPRPKANRKPGKSGDSDEEDDEDKDDVMSVDEVEEEAVREVIDLVSEGENDSGDDDNSDDEEEDNKEDEEEEEEKARPAPRRSLRRSMAKKPTEDVVVLPARRSVRHVRTMSSSSSDLTVSESESSASPPSLDSRPAVKGKSTTTTNSSSTILPKVLTPVQAPTAPRTRRASEAVLKIIKVDEPTSLGKPRRSERMSRGDNKQSAPPPGSSAPAPTPAIAAAASSKSKDKSSSTTTATGISTKSKRNGEKEKEKEKETPITTRAGALKTQKRVLRSRA